MSSQPMLKENQPLEVKSWRDKIPLLIAITTVVLAVCATLASFKAAGYGNKVVLCQTQASDQWAFYQAKSIKGTTYEVMRDAMALGMNQAVDPAAVQTKIAEYDTEIMRYNQEKNDIANNAKRLELEKDDARKLNSIFGESLIYLQIGILLSSLASINKNYYYWYMGTAVGALGIVTFLYALTIS